MIIPQLTPNTIMSLTNTIIGPHGMTDLIHAKENKNLEQLYRVNLITIASSYGLHVIHCDNILNILFMIASIVHFRNDMPYFNKDNSSLNKAIFQLFLSSILILTTYGENSILFFLYMLVIHVPNHYKMSWSFIKNNLRETITLLSIASLIFTGLKYNPATMLDDWLSKGIIISHIVYEETGIFKDVKKIEDEINGIIQSNLPNNIL